MLTVLEVIRRTTEHFARAGLEKPKTDAEWLVAHGLECPRLQLYLQHDRPIEDEKLQTLRQMVRRRSKREPLQYIIGWVPFLDLRIRVSPEALIPRPETEEWVSALIETGRNETPRRVLDLGTGSGAIALAIAHHLPDTEVVAIDSSPEALALARDNASDCGLDDRVRFVAGSWFDQVEGRFDWILSNPPYLSLDEWRECAPEVREFEPKQALTPGDDGASALAEITRKAILHLNDGGMLVCETGIHQHSSLEEWARAAGYREWRSNRDFSGRPRWFQAWK